MSEENKRERVSLFLSQFIFHPFNGCFEKEGHKMLVGSLSPYLS